jgi:hypothetical protein
VGIIGASEIASESGNLDDVEGEGSCDAIIFGTIWHELIEYSGILFPKRQRVLSGDNYFFPSTTIKIPPLG